MDSPPLSPTYRLYFEERKKKKEMLFAWKCVYIRVHPSIFRVGPARSTLSSVLMCVAKLNELRGDPLLLFSFLFFFWLVSFRHVTDRPTDCER
jgi:hypothetical protein